MRIVMENRNKYMLMRMSVKNEKAQDFPVLIKLRYLSIE